MAYVGTYRALLAGGVSRPALSLDFLGGALDSRITFSRGSNATLTDSTGKITYAPANLLTYSEQFDNAAWTKTRCSISADATTAPNGTNTADKLVEDTTASATHPVSVGFTTSAITYSLSVYMKAAGRTWGFLSLIGTANAYASFNLSTGVLGTVGSAATATITAVGNGWYRCSIVATTAAGANTIGIYPASADNTTSYTGDGTSGIYLWGAQLEPVTYQTTPGPYQATTSSAYYGPRFDYNPVTLAAKGLLIEEQRTNNFTYSQLLNNAAWNRLGMTITEDQIVAPDGTLTADKCEVVANERQFSGQNQIATFPIGTTATWSIYAKKGNVASWPFRISTITAYDTTFNFDTGLFSGTSAGLTPTASPIGNGWYRLTFTITVPASSTSVIMQWRTYVNSASGVGDFAYFWGAQAETGAFATSYIPTVASTVTRSADVATMTGANFSSWYNQTQGTMVASFTSFMPTVNSQTVYTISDGTNNNRLFSYASSNAIRQYMVNGGVAQADISVSTYAANTIFNSAFAVVANSVQAAVNGTLGTEDTNATLPTVDRLTLGASAAATTTFLNGHIRSIAYYNVRLPNSQLQALTT